MTTATYARQCYGCGSEIRGAMLCEACAEDPAYESAQFNAPAPELAAAGRRRARLARILARVLGGLRVAFWSLAAAIVGLGLLAIVFRGWLIAAAAWLVEAWHFFFGGVD